MSSSSDSTEINDNYFVTLDGLKDYLGITDKQDDSTLLKIIVTANNEVKKNLITVVDDITAIQGTKFFDRASDAALTYCMSQYRRDINQMYDESDKILKDYNSQIQTLLGDVRAIAPKRTSREVVTRDVPFEDDYFAERHIP